MRGFKRTYVHENLLKQLKEIKMHCQRYKHLSIPEISAKVKVVPIEVKKNTLVKRIQKILEEWEKNTRFE